MRTFCALSALASDLWKLSVVKALVRDVEPILLHRQHRELALKDIENSTLLGNIRTVHRDDIDVHRAEDTARVVRRHTGLALDRIKRHWSCPEIVIRQIHHR